MRPHLYQLAGHRAANAQSACVFLMLQATERDLSKYFMEGCIMDFEAIKTAAEGYRAEMSRFLRDMISHPSESCEEKDVVMCI